jgi:hypothetical protein
VHAYACACVNSSMLPHCKSDQCSNILRNVCMLQSIRHVFSPASKCCLKAWCVLDLNYNVPAEMWVNL